MLPMSWVTKSALWILSVSRTRATSPPWLFFLVIAILGMRREPHPAQVRNDNDMIVHQRRRQGRPHIPRVAEAVQHDDDRPLAADPDVDRRAASFDLFGTKIGRGSLKFCHAKLPMSGTGDSSGFATTAPVAPADHEYGSNFRNPGFLATSIIELLTDLTPAYPAVPLHPSGSVPGLDYRSSASSAFAFRKSFVPKPS